MFASASAGNTIGGSSAAAGTTVSSNPATVTLTVTPVHDAPVALPDSYRTNMLNTLRVAAPGLLGNDTDVDGDGLTAELVSGPRRGTLALAADGSFTYRPRLLALTGTDTFTYRACDGTTCSAPSTVSIRTSLLTFGLSLERGLL